MNALLIHPVFPDTFWSYKHALSFVGKKAILPPLGLATVAALFPPNWSVRLVDTNVRTLTADDLAWAHYAFVGAMTVQRESARQIIGRCNSVNLPVVAGGPLFTSDHEQYPTVDHFVLNEAELTLPRFLTDLAGGVANRIYATDQFADLEQTPAPRWDLLDLERYAGMSIQFSRGCPFQCDFCNVTTLLGHRVRTKTSQQVIAELDGLYKRGWRNEVFFADDNFIGSKAHLKADLLPALVKWRTGKKGLPLITQVSINLADDTELMSLMVAAGFNKVFVGIETPDEACLAECDKQQNRNRGLLHDVKRIQRSGMEVQAGFIVGFDHDLPSVFDRHIEFIQSSGIVTAMVGMLQAPPGTRLYERLEKEGRISGESTGDNVDGTTNIVPVMGLEALQSGHRRVLQCIYSSEAYYSRIKTFLSEYQPPGKPEHLGFQHLVAFVKASYRLGIASRARAHYWQLIAWTQRNRPELIRDAITLAICGHHYRKTCELVAT